MSDTTLSAVQSASILALSGDTHRATAALLEPVSGSYRLIGWESWESPGGSSSALAQSLRAAAQRLGERLGRPLWDESQDSPVMAAPDPALHLGLGHVVAAVDPLPPLRVWIGGLTGEESLAGAQAALDATICQTVALYRYGLGGGPDRLAEELNDCRPDLAVLVGGYDKSGGTARRAVLELCNEVAQALDRLAVGSRPALYFAGNRWAAAQALEMMARLSGGLSADAVENVSPGPGQHRATSLAVATSRLYWRRCRATPAVQSINRWITPPSEVRTLSWSFAQAVRLWRQVHALPALHGLFCAGPLWIHVRALDGEEGVRMRFVPAHTRPATLNGWPPLRLVSGPWP
ncbi:MAG TPA: glutamate mutase L, partial [Caldilineaceae bacterium]|nr:glutamate mutase L [Caldilineaceae bacterium]